MPDTGCWIWEVMLLAVLDHLLQPDPILIIDCARMGKKPGEVAGSPWIQSRLRQTDQLISLHGFSVSEIYRLATKLGSVAPAGVFGIEPGSWNLTLIVTAGEVKYSGCDTNGF